MLIWRGVNWGKDFAERITKEKFQVHSVFRTVVNLQSEQESPLLSITTRPEAMGLNTCFVEGTIFSDNLNQGDSFEYHQSLLQTGRSYVNCERIQVWQPRNWSYQEGTGSYQMVKHILELQAPGLADSRNHLTEQLSASLMTDDEDLLRTALKGFLGHGEGLTPSGDDFVTGVLLAFVLGCKLTKSTSKFLSLLPSIIKDVWWRTNSISQTMLWYAAQGEGAAYVADVAGAIFAESAEVATLASRLWHVGATSGRYLLSGVLLGSEIFRRREQ